MSEDMRNPHSPQNEDVRIGVAVTARRCACKGWIVSPHLSVGDAIERHQIEEPHKSWDRAAWVEANTAKVAVKVVVRRVA